MTFRSRKTWWFGAIFWFSIIVAIYALVIIILKGSIDNIFVNSISGVMMAASAGLLLWIWYGTFYRLSDEYLQYYSGPIRGRIPLEKITRVEAGRTMWSGTRPALATRGIIIHYGKYDAVYISPDDNSVFIRQLLKLNPEIRVDHHLFT